MRVYFFTFLAMIFLAGISFSQESVTNINNQQIREMRQRLLDSVKGFEYEEDSDGNIKGKIVDVGKFFDWLYINNMLNEENLKKISNFIIDEFYVFGIDFVTNIVEYTVYEYLGLTENPNPNVRFFIRDALLLGQKYNLRNIYDLLNNIKQSGEVKRYSYEYKYLIFYACVIAIQQNLIVKNNYEKKNKKMDLLLKKKEEDMTSVEYAIYLFWGKNKIQWNKIILEVKEIIAQKNQSVYEFGIKNFSQIGLKKIFNEVVNEIYNAAKEEV